MPELRRASVENTRHSSLNENPAIDCTLLPMDAYRLVCRAVIPALGSFYAGKLRNDCSLGCWSFQVLVCAIGRKHFYFVPNEG